ncbi:MAG: DUF411 domain-containing protein [bacterium]
MTDDVTMTRRTWLASMMGRIAGASALMTLLPSRARAEEASVALTVYKDPSCGCCKKWVAHLTQNGFTPFAKDRTDMSALKDSLGIPVALRSCHTAIAGKLVIEGHVPAADVKRFLATSPKGVLGLAVPGMPSGSPGMEMSGQSDRYDVVAFTADGKTSVFATH